MKSTWSSSEIKIADDISPSFLHEIVGIRPWQNDHQRIKHYQTTAFLQHQSSIRERTWELNLEQLWNQRTAETTSHSSCTDPRIVSYYHLGQSTHHDNVQISINELSGSAIQLQHSRGNEEIPGAALKLKSPTTYCLRFCTKRSASSHDKMITKHLSSQHLFNKKLRFGNERVPEAALRLKSPATHRLRFCTKMSASSQKK